MKDFLLTTEEQYRKLQSFASYPRRPCAQLSDSTLGFSRQEN